MSSSTSIIVVGAGKWGVNHITTAHSIGVLIAIVDTNSSALNKIAQQLGPKNGVFFYSTISEALLSLPESSVIIATPPKTHFSIAKQVIEARRHIFVEKPLCTTLQEAADLVRLAEDYNVILMVDHLLQYSHDHRNLIQLIQMGFVGKVTRVRMCRLNFGTVRTEENVLWSFCPHDISILLSICNDQTPVSVVCTGQKVVSDGIEDYVDINLKFDNGIQAQIEASWLHPLKERRLIVYGSSGCLVLNEAMPDPNLKKLQGFKWSAKRKPDGSRVVIEKTEQDLLRYINSKEGSTTTSIEKSREKPPLQIAIEHFVDCIQQNGAQIPRTDGHEGLRVLNVLSAATESLIKEGSIVNLPLGSKTFKTYIHPTAVVDHGSIVGAGTKVWHFSHIMSGAKLGERCNIGQNVFIGGKALLGKNVKVQNNVSIYDSVNIADDVFLGPSCVLTNVKTPRSEISRKHEFSPTTIGKGATIGANSTIVCGIRLGKYCFVGAGAVVTKDVPAHNLVYGNPATSQGWVSTTGARLREVANIGHNRKVLQCIESKEVYTLYEKGHDGSSSPCIIKNEDT